MMRIKAKIYLWREEENSMDRDGFSGMQPSFNINNELIMCRVYEASGKKKMILGMEHNVQIELPYGEMFAHEITAGTTFLLQVGSKVIGKGEVLSIIGADSIKQKKHIA